MFDFARQAVSPTLDNLHASNYCQYICIQHSFVLMNSKTTFDIWHLSTVAGTSTTQTTSGINPDVVAQDIRNEDKSTRVNIKRPADSVEASDSVPAKKSLFLSLFHDNRYLEEKSTRQHTQKRRNNSKITMPSLTRTCITLPRIKRLNFHQFQGKILYFRL